MSLDSGTCSLYYACILGCFRCIVDSFLIYLKKIGLALHANCLLKTNQNDFFPSMLGIKQVKNTSVLKYKSMKGPEKSAWIRSLIWPSPFVFGLRQFCVLV